MESFYGIRSSTLSPSCLSNRVTANVGCIQAAPCLGPTERWRTYDFRLRQAQIWKTRCWHRWRRSWWWDAWPVPKRRHWNNVNAISTLSDSWGWRTYWGMLRRVSFREVSREWCKSSRWTLESIECLSFQSQFTLGSFRITIAIWMVTIRQLFLLWKHLTIE